MFGITPFAAAPFSSLGSNVFNDVLGESISVTDSTTEELVVGLSIAETVSLTDSVTSTAVQYLAFSDTITMGLLGASLTALIQMLNGIAGTAPKQEKPEFEVIKDLITRLDKLDRTEPPMQVDVEGSKVTVKKGADIVTAKG